MKAKAAVLASVVLLAGCPRDNGSDTPDATKNPDAMETPDAMEVPKGDPVINELMRKPPDDPNSGVEEREFIEIKGDANTDYSDFWILQVRGNGDPTDLGIIRSAHQVGTTNADGYWDTGYLTDILKNNTYTYLLVKNYQAPGGGDPDVDSNNDGTIDTTFWDEIVDDVAIEDDGGAGATDFKYSTVVLTPGLDGNADEWEGASRIPDGTDTDTTADWVRNDPDGAGLDGFAGTPENGEALSTIGAANQSINLVTGAVINEFVFNHTGSDDYEFVEIKGDANTDYSALSIVIIDGDVGTTGNITYTVAVGTTDANGYWHTGYVAGMMQNSSQTMLLVQDYVAPGDLDLDTNDDGTLDSTPWTAVLDSVGIQDADVTDPIYLGAPVIVPGQDGGTFPYGGGSRLPNGVDTNSPGDWVRNDFNGDGLPITPAPAPALIGTAVNTQGADNMAGQGT